MPFSHVNLQRDLADIGSNFDGAPGLGDSQRDDVEGLRSWWAD